MLLQLLFFPQVYLQMPVITTVSYINLVKDFLEDVTETEYRVRHAKLLQDKKHAEASILKQTWLELNGHKIPALLK